MCIDARSGGKSLAEVTFFELRPFREEDKAVLKLLAQVVACIRQGRAEQMTEIARYFQLFIGVSRDFSGLRYVRAYYLQAEFAMRQAMKTRRDMMRYDECMLEDMIAHCRKERNLTTYCRPEILELMAYDAQNETDYAGTFRCYCENLCNMAQTARTVPQVPLAVLEQPVLPARRVRTAHRAMLEPTARPGKPAPPEAREKVVLTELRAAPAPLAALVLLVGTQCPRRPPTARCRP